MTGPATDARETDDAGGPGGTSGGPPGSRTFGLEGRAAPGLYLVAWLATILGGIFLLVALLAGGGGTAVALGLAGSALFAVGFVAGAGSQALERSRRAVALDPARDAEPILGDPTAPPRDPFAGPYVGPSPFLVFAASLPLTILLVALLMAPLALLGVAPTSPAAALLSVVVTGVVYLALIRLLVVGPGALSWREMGLVRFGPAQARELIAGAALAVPVILLTAVLADLLVRLLGTVPDSPLPPATDAPGLVANLLAAAIVAPIGEELFYRGFATTAWARGVGPSGAIVRGAVFFAVVHILAIGGGTFGEAAGRVAIAFIGRLPVAFALGWLFVRRRSLYASIGLHATFNLALIVLAEFASRIAGF